ncbi:hypothetical protein GLA29479_5170 [Lysobacter antibioticus]|uniref:Uncharacterized protein n=1 Tax=Lysobacter antibioticus TaxID=84531 RepID=A0A0S2F627_LYSAN|nr:hypothetical protein GLA29479_5170 [Lysobacter antibioticus]ALN79000.1 hypothetical protein LA76x_0839 [Lysobacter antibioticus]
MQKIRGDRHQERYPDLCMLMRALESSDAIEAVHDGSGL